MKKVLSMLCVLAMVLSLASCGGSTSSAAPATSSAAPAVSSAAPAASSAAPAASNTAPAAPAASTALVDTDVIKIVKGVAEFTCGTATTGGWVYMYGTSACKVINDHSPLINVTAAITTGGNENMERIVTRDIAMGTAGTPVAYDYYNGNKAEGIEPHPELRTVYGSGPNPFNFIVLGSSPYKTIEDLKGKKVSISSPGGSSSLLAERILEALGYGVKSGYFDIQYLSPQESCDAMKTGGIDALFISATAPHSAITDFFLTAQGGGRFLEISEEQKKACLGIADYMYPSVTPAGTYNGQNTDYNSVGSFYGLYVMEDFPEELAYQMAKSLNENYEEWLSVFVGVAGSTAQSTIDTKVCPLHPGTERYFKEIGLIK